MYFFGQLLQVLLAIGENNAIFVFQCSGDMPRDKRHAPRIGNKQFHQSGKVRRVASMGSFDDFEGGKTVGVLSRVTVWGRRLL